MKHFGEALGIVLLVFAVYVLADPSGIGAALGEFVAAFNAAGG